MIKLISFIVLTHFFQFDQLNILRQPRLLTFFKLNQQYFFYSVAMWQTWVKKLIQMSYNVKYYNY